MYYVAETEKLIADGVISDEQAREIKSRARTAMVTLSVNTLLIAGTVAATFGLVLYLGTPLSVAICGGVFLAAGLLILRFGKALYRMFGNASALIGAGMLVSGTAIGLMDQVPDDAGLLIIVIGAFIAGFCAWGFKSGLPHLRFALGAILVMGCALHAFGVYDIFAQINMSAWVMPCVHFYVFALIVILGVFLDTKLITALAIFPFAQMLDTGSYYFNGGYAFYSQEPTLSILQMSLLIGVCIWAARHWNACVARQAGILMIMAFVVANLCFLLGSIRGDIVGETIWGPIHHNYIENRNYVGFIEDRDTFRATAFKISEHSYAIIWALLLAGLTLWSAMSNRRGLFNTAMTFAAIHGYTQFFESFYENPLAYVIGGLMAIPLAFGLWRLNNVWFQNLNVAETP